MFVALLMMAVADGDRLCYVFILVHTRAYLAGPRVLLLRGTTTLSGRALRRGAKTSLKSNLHLQSQSSRSSGHRWVVVWMSMH